MDFLDPKKERYNELKLLVGYVLVAVAIVIATILLLYRAYGYNVSQDGQVTQNGIVFVSSQPSDATIHLNGKQYKSNTNARVIIPSGNYLLQVAKSGYLLWQRHISVNGGDVQHFDYPFLIPRTLQTSNLSELAADPSMATESPDKRWLLLGQAEASGSFTLYDVKNPKKPVATTITLPDGTFKTGESDGAQSWSLVEWATDNRHVLLLHTYVLKGVDTREYIVLDRADPTASLNLTDSLHLSQMQTVSLFDNRISQFYVYDKADNSLRRVDSDGQEQSRLEHVLAFKTYADDKILYVTDQPPVGKTAAGTVTAVLLDGGRSTSLRALPAGAAHYSLDIAQYDGDWYVLAAADNDNAAYIYKNPGSETPGADAFVAPYRRLPLKNPGSMLFSNNTQYVVAESGQDFITYDLENLMQYRYHATEPLDAPQTHATWMDGNRLLYVSGGKLVMFDYDYLNKHNLVPASANYLPFFSADYTYLYTLVPAKGDAKPALTTTPLTIKQQ